jgi:hypothetical protein
MPPRDNLSPQLSVEQRITNIENWLKWLLRATGITLAGLLVFAFWLGTISTKVSNADQTTTKVYGVVAENKDSLLVRTSLIENRLVSMDEKLNSMDANLKDLVKFREKVKVDWRELPNPEQPPKQ